MESVNSIRVLHLPHSVGGNQQGLNIALKKMGVSSTAVSIVPHEFQYKSDRCIAREGDSFTIKKVKAWVSIFYIYKNCDVVHFNFGDTLAGVGPLDLRGKSLKIKFVSILNHWLSRMFFSFELFVLKALEKPYFVTYQGDDARQGDFCKENYDISIANVVDGSYYSEPSDKFKRWKIDTLCIGAKKVYSLNPDLLHVLPEKATFQPYCHVNMNDWLPIYSQDTDKPLKICHAPSNRIVKGTPLIIQALNELQQEGYNFELLLVEGMPNDRAREVYESSDILIDQLHAGWYGGLAVEVMALGKPVISYIRESDLQFIPEEMKKDLPIINITPSSVKDTIKKVLEMPRSKLENIAKCSRAYVERWHDPERISSEVLNDYKDSLHTKKGMSR